MSYELYVFFGTLLVILLAVILIAYAIEFNKRQIKHYKERELMNAQFQQVLLQTQLEIQEQTFKNISQEIHDNIGQVLTLAKLNMNAMPTFESTVLQEKFDNTKNLVNKALQDLRDLSKGLNTDYISSVGLVKSIEYEVGQLRKVAGLETEISVEGHEYDLTQQKELILFRIFQEAINNVIKHSKASLVNVEMTFLPNLFSLHIKDNGSGFNLNENNLSQGLGLKNMKNRSNLIGAKFYIGSKAGVGTTVKIELPMTSSK